MQECTVGSMCIKASPSCPTSLSSLFFLATWWVSWCAPVWTYNLACLRCFFQTAAAWFHASIKSFTHWFFFCFRFPCMITICRCVHRVVRSWDPTALRRASKPQQPAAARVRVGLCGHSWATQDWHIKQAVIGLSRGHTIQHLIPMEFQLLTKLYLWNGGHRPSAAATWTADRTFFSTPVQALRRTVHVQHKWTSEVGHDWWFSKKWNLVVFKFFSVPRLLAFAKSFNAFNCILHRTSEWVNSCINVAICWLRGSKGRFPASWEQTAKIDQIIRNRIFIVAIKTVFARFRIFIATIKLRPNLIFLWWR